jgi:ribose 5-phosphate isomerase B
MPLLQSLGHEVEDLGVGSPESCDYPDLAFSVGEIVGTGKMERGILLCGTGIGMCMAANKVPGVRAAVCHDRLSAEMSRRHNDANVLCLSADLLGKDVLERIVRIWLETSFDGGRHARRVEKINSYQPRRGS